MDESINLYKRLYARKTRTLADQYVEQILVIDINQGTSGLPLQVQGEQLMLPGLEYPISHQIENEMGDTMLNDHFFDHEGWDDLGFQFSDNFALDFGASLL